MEHGVLSPLEITAFLWISLFGTYLFYWFKKTKANWAEFEGTEVQTQAAFTCSKSTIETAEQYVKSVQS